MAAIEPEWVIELVEAFPGVFVPAVDQPAVGGKYRRRSEETVAVPPVTRATGRATGTEYASRRFID